MIRNIITTAILLATLVSMVSVAQVANAVEPELSKESSAFENNLANSNHPFAWSPDVEQQKKVIDLHERIILPNSIGSTDLTEPTNSEQRLLSFEIYQGDGLDDLRQQSKHHNNITLPDEDTSAYGISVKQRF